MWHDVSGCSEVKATAQREKEMKQCCGNCSAGPSPWCPASDGSQGHLQGVWGAHLSKKQIYLSKPHLSHEVFTAPRGGSVWKGPWRSPSAPSLLRDGAGHVWRAELSPGVCVHCSHLGSGPQTQCGTSASLSSLTLPPGKSIHFCAEDKAAGNSINQSTVEQWQKMNKRTQKLPETLFTKIETFSWGHVRLFSHWPFGSSRSFWRTFINVWKPGSFYLFSWRHPAFGRSLPPCQRSCLESWDCVQEEGLINKISTPRICCFQGHSSTCQAVLMLAEHGERSFKSSAGKIPNPVPEQNATSSLKTCMTDREPCSCQLSLPLGACLLFLNTFSLWWFFWQRKQKGLSRAVCNFLI